MRDNRDLSTCHNVIGGENKCSNKLCKKRNKLVSYFVWFIWKKPKVIEVSVPLHARLVRAQGFIKEQRSA